ncbi:MAG: sigma-54 dependent transcriptional regulator [Sandaracinus sp.]
MAERGLSPASPRASVAESRPRVLVVDDDAGLRFALAELVREMGGEPLLAEGGAEALAKLAQADVAIIDYAMPEMDGLELLDRIRALDPRLPVVMLTAHGSERLAVHAVQKGAYDYLRKPFETDEMMAVLRRAAEASRLRRIDWSLRMERAVGRALVGTSAVMRRLLDDAGRVAGRDLPVLVTGESGTGKELVATLLHAEGARAKGPLVRFNCAALPSELADAELFGHVKGAFTGAVASRPGYFARASGGTLVLDEVGELPLGIQAKLLRALQEGEIQPVGAARTEKVDVRIVACTNRDLAEEVRAGRFRQDLYFRLAVVELRVPALRERREDVPALADLFLARYAERFGVVGASLSPRLVAELSRREWPGNVRQLESTIARLVALTEGGMLDVAHLDDPSAETKAAPEPPRLSLKEQVQAYERGLILRALEESHGNQVRAAQALAVSRATLIDKMRRYGIRRAIDDVEDGLESGPSKTDGAS